MSVPLRFAFAGKAYSGKSSCAKYLASKHNMSILSFATILKETCKEVFDMQVKDRSLLQKVGSALRDINKNVFVDYLERKIEKIGYSVGICIDDLRYKNEFEMLQRQNFILVKLIVDEEILKERALKLTGQIMTTEQINHPSETDLDNIYHGFTFITGNSTEEDLYNKLDVLYKREKEKQE